YLKVFCLDKLISKRDSIRTVRYIKKLLIQSAKKNGMVTFWLEKFPLNTQLNNNCVKKIERVESRIWKKTKPVCDTVIYFMNKDQEYRKPFVDSIQAYFNPSDKEYIDYQQLIKEEDFKNQLQFLDYIKANGYPGYSKS